VIDPMHWSSEAQWNDDTLEWGGLDDRVRSAWLDLGDPVDPNRPLLMFVRYAPGIVVKPHSHGSDYSSMVLQGEVKITGRSHAVGSIRLVSAGTVYGPLVAGPEGTTLLDIFSRRDGALPIWAKPSLEDRDRLEALDRYLRARLEAVEARPRLRAEHRAANSSRAKGNID
jgi:hypothetical protein